MAAKNKLANILFIVFALIGGICLLLSAVSVINSLAFAAKCQRAEGTVIRNSWTKATRGLAHPVVQFHVNDQTFEFEGSAGTSPSAYSTNDRVSVFYLPADPHHAVIDSFTERYLLPLILGLFGLVFSSIGGGFLIVPIILKRRRERIVADGVPVQAKVTEINIDRSVSVNEQHPWVLVAKFWDDVSNQTITCTSHYLWEDPSHRYPVGSQVTVYHLQDRPEKCAFQLEESPGEA